MERMVSVHHVDKDAFLKGNVEHDPEEKVLVFDRSPNYAEVVEKVRLAFNWTNPNDVVTLEGRHNVGFGMHSWWKTMPLNSESCWSIRRWWRALKTRISSYLPQRSLT